MSQSQLLMIGAFALVLLLGGIWWLNTPTAEAPVTSEDTTEPAPRAEAPNTDTTQPDPAEGSLRDLITRGEALECTFSFTEEDGTSGEGTGYFAGDERMSMETTITQDGQTMTANYVIQDEVMYMWGDSQQGNFAMQMPFSEVEASETHSEQIPVDVDQNVDYQCESWSLDPSVFSIPQDREFMDLGAMMQGKQGMEEMNQEDIEALQEQFGGPQQ